MRKLFPLFILFLFCSCSSISLEEDPIVQEHFSETEIASLDSILTYFDTEVINQTPNTEVISSYNELFQIVKDSVETGSSITIELDYQNLEALFIQMTDSFQQEIWSTGYSYNSNTGDSIFVRDINPDGKYAAFLKSSSEKNDYLIQYYEGLKNAEGISPGMNTNMLLSPEELDMNKERERLIYATHFITLRKSSAH